MALRSADDTSIRRLVATRVPVRRETDVNPRKTPRQRRSEETAAVILEAAARVLARDGAAGFTTNRVAERAGVSVGSVYQYFPNKQALLYALHAKEIAATTTELAGILTDASRSSRERLHAAIRRFLETESDEAAMRSALEEAGVRVEASPAISEARTKIAAVIGGFLSTTAARPPENVEFEAHAALTIVASVAANVTKQVLAPEDLERWSSVLGDMIAERFGLER
jgi:AcrR family transcriptional regulator